MAISSLSPWVIAALTAYLAYRYFSTATTLRKLPPGPKPLPLLGNARDSPPADVPEFEHWLKHKDEHGPVSSVTVLGMTLVIIHDEGAAREILEQAASRTSGRPTIVFANEICRRRSSRAYRRAQENL